MGLRVSKLGKLQDKGKLGKIHVYSEWSCDIVIVAPPIVVGAWSMAYLLGQRVEYYYVMISGTYVQQRRFRG